MTNEQFNYMRQICLKLKPQINLAKYFLGISYYYLNDYQNAKKAFLSSDLEIESLSISSKKYLESINNNTYISNPLKNN